MTTTEALEAATSISEMIALDKIAADTTTANYHALRAILIEQIGDLDHASLEAKLLFNMIHIADRFFSIR